MSSSYSNPYPPRRASAPQPDVRDPRDTGYELADDERLYQPRTPSSVRRYRPMNARTGEQSPSRAVMRQGRRDMVIYHGEVEYEPRTRATTSPPAREGSSGLHPLVYVGVTLLLTLLGYVAPTQLGQWWYTFQDDRLYGRPRTFQVDAVVGHHHDSARSPSHFVAVNLHRHLLVIEFPAGDASQAKVYAGPVLLGAGQDLDPVTLSFADVNGDGKPDLLLHVDQSAIVLLNDGTGFRPERPGEQLGQSAGTPGAEQEGRHA